MLCVYILASLLRNPTSNAAMTGEEMEMIKKTERGEERERLGEWSEERISPPAEWMMTNEKGQTNTLAQEVRGN